MKESKWSNKWIWSSIVNGLFLVIWTLYFFGPVQPTPSPSRVIAAGSAGTWLFVGYISYLTVGVLASSVTAYHYYYIESILNRKVLSKLAWIHLILGNIGVIGATWLLMVAGYQGGSALLPKEVGGLGLTPPEVHEMILKGYPPVIGIFIIIAAIGFICGGLAYLLAWWKGKK